MKELERLIVKEDELLVLRVDVSNMHQDDIEGMKNSIPDKFKDRTLFIDSSVKVATIENKTQNAIALRL